MKSQAKKKVQHNELDQSAIQSCGDENVENVPPPPQTLKTQASLLQSSSHSLFQQLENIDERSAILLKTAETQVNLL